MTDKEDGATLDANAVDAIKLSLMLTDLRLPTIKDIWQTFSSRSDAEGWTAARFLATLAEHELAERDRRRIERHLRDARLLPGKSLANFDFTVVPMISKAQVNALAAGDAWLSQGGNCLVFGPPGSARAISPPLSASHWSRTDIVCCSPAPQTWSNACSSRVANSPLKPHRQT